MSASRTTLTSASAIALDRVLGTRRIVSVMGTVFSVDVRDIDPSSAAVNQVVAWWRWVDATFSTYRADSVITQLTEGTRLWNDCPTEVQDVVDGCRQALQDSDGYFNAYPHGRFDPTGYVKGWSVEIASRMLSDAGSRHHCIAAGGDLRSRGEPEPGTAWRLGVVDPFDLHRVAAVVIGHDLAVATSGTAERGSHIINPHTGGAATELASVTLVGADLAQIDALATAAFAMGSVCREWLASRADVDALIVTAEGEVWTTPSFPGFRLDLAGRS